MFNACQHCQGGDIANNLILNAMEMFVNGCEHDTKQTRQV